MCCLTLLSAYNKPAVVLFHFYLVRTISAAANFATNFDELSFARLVTVFYLDGRRWIIDEDKLLDRPVRGYSSCATSISYEQWKTSWWQNIDRCVDDVLVENRDAMTQIQTARDMFTFYLQTMFFWIEQMTSWQSEQSTMSETAVRTSKNAGNCKTKFNLCLSQENCNTLFYGHQVTIVCWRCLCRAVCCKQTTALCRTHTLNNRPVTQWFDSHQL